MFSWSGYHNVYLHPSGDCSEAGATGPTSGSAGTSGAAFDLARAGTYTFACDVGSHCELGQIVTITVTGDAAATGPTTPRTSPAREPAADDSAAAGGGSASQQQQQQAASRRSPARAGDSVAPRQRRRVASSLEIGGADIATIAPGTAARDEFELDFRTSMADSLGELVEPSDILIEDIRSAGGSGRRRQLQAGSITVDFSILADEDEATAAQSAAVALQSSSTPLALTVGGEVVMVTPSTAMAPPSEAVVADLDCEGTWSCNANSCVLTFTSTQTQSGGGGSCPAEPSCVCVDPAAAAGGEAAADDGGVSGAVIVLAAVGSAVGLCAAWCYCSRRSTSVCSEDADAESPKQQQMGKGQQQQQQIAPAVAPGPGSAVQIWSKSSQTWCRGQVVKVVSGVGTGGGGDAVDVAYIVGGRDTKERRKVVRIDSENLQFPQQQQQQRRGAGPYP
eukprot:COSAG06_NODE_1953_length_7994_cov_40.573583_2_plen_450_part_00